MIKAMAEEWLVRVEGKDYGPADLEMLRDWKREGRVLPTNPVRQSDGAAWTTAAEIPGLFEAAPPLMQPPAEGREREAPGAGEEPPATIEPSSLGRIFSQSVAIYRAGFF